MRAVQLLPNPEPSFAFAAGDVLVVLGRLERHVIAMSQ